jgi:hypothetical protein
MRNSEGGRRNSEGGRRKADYKKTIHSSILFIPHSAFRLQKVLNLLLRRLVCGEIQGFIRAQQEDGALLDLQILASE